MKKISITVVAVLGLFLCRPLVFAHPVHEAAMAGDLEKVQEILAQGVDVNLPDAMTLTPLHFAAGGGG